MYIHTHMYTNIRTHSQPGRRDAEGLGRPRRPAAGAGAGLLGAGMRARAGPFERPCKLLWCCYFTVEMRRRSSLQYCVPTLKETSAVFCNNTFQR